MPATSPFTVRLWTALADCVAGSVADCVADARLALRSLRRAPAFAVVTIATLGLGIGATTSVLTIVDHVLLRSLPFRDPGRVMMLLERGDRGGFRTPSAPTAADWRNDPGARQAFEEISFVRGDGAVIRQGDGVTNIGVAYVGPEFFATLGVRAALGRLLTPEDHRADAPVAAVISYDLWQDTFGGDRGILGRKIDIDSVPTIVVGVMPLGGTYPGFGSVWESVSQYRHPETLMRRGLHADSRTIGRLRPGVDSARAAALLRPVSARLAAAYPAEQARWSAAMLPVRDELLGGIGSTLYTLGAAAIAILLLACANVANLLLARAASRSREIAVRSALGASRGRLLRHQLSESLVLAVSGGLLGTGLAALAVRVAQTLPPDKLPRVDELALDHRVLVLAAAASILTALICGLWPAMRASRSSGLDALRAGTLGSIGARSDSKLRRALVVGQFALALTLLVGAGLLLQSFRRAMDVSVGFDPRGLVDVRVNPRASAYPSPADAAALYDRLMRAVRTVPGVTGAAFINHFPFGRAAITTPVEIEGRSAVDTASHQVFYRTVSASYFKTMKLSLASGRWFEDSDVRSPGGEFVINQSMARVYWPGENAVGKRLTVRRSSQARADFGQPLAGAVIGVIADVHQVRQDVAPDPEIYVPYTLETWPWGNIVVRVRDGARSIPALRAAITAVDPTLIERGSTGAQRFGVVESSIVSSLAPRKLSMALIALFGACALVLAAIGMFGVVSYGVAQRTRELGVRKALGATNEMISLMLLRESLVLAAVGVILGCFGAWVGTRYIRDLLFETGVADPLAYAATVVLLLSVALLATWWPAKRAMRLDPTIAMRGE
jgi:putative ABC transport system permease protein